jgi:ribonuclease VapC
VVIASSAALGILFAEEDAPDFARAIAKARSARRISAANWLETAIRVDVGGNPMAINAFDDFMRKAAVIVEAVTLEQARSQGMPIPLRQGDGPRRRTTL